MPLLGNLSGSSFGQVYAQQNVRPHEVSDYVDGKVVVSPTSLKGQAAAVILADARYGRLEKRIVRSSASELGVVVLASARSREGYRGGAAVVFKALGTNPNLPPVLNNSDVAYLFDELGTCSGVRKTIANIKEQLPTPYLGQLEGETVDVFVDKVAAILLDHKDPVTGRSATDDFVDTLFDGPIDYQFLAQLVSYDEWSKALKSNIAKVIEDKQTVENVKRGQTVDFLQWPQVKARLKAGEVPKLFTDIIVGKHKDTPGYAEITLLLGVNPEFRNLLKTSTANGGIKAI